MNVYTENSEYRIDRARGRVRRRPIVGDSMRRDGDELEFSDMRRPVVGEPLAFLLEPLGDGNVTIRITSPVTKIEE